MPILLFNLAMLASDTAVLRYWWIRRDLGSFLRGGGAAIGTILALAAAGEWYARTFTLFGPLFTFAGLLAWGLFLHCPILLIGTAVGLRRRARLLSRLLVLAALGSLLLAGYAFIIEPNWLEITHYEVRSPKIERRLRIVVLADLQTDRIGSYEEWVIQAALRESPDLLILPGDYLHVGSEEEFQRLRAELNRLLRREGFTASLGVFAVRGNVDHDAWERIFEGLDVHTFTKTASVDVGGIRVTAVALRDSFDTHLRIAPTSGFHIAFGHGPDFALGDIRADLILAGHTHGGQVRLPGIGPLVTLSRVPRSWAAGRTELSGGRTLIVSRGIGMERGFAPQLRFLCRPELAVVDVVPESP